MTSIKRFTTTAVAIACFSALAAVAFPRPTPPLPPIADIGHDHGREMRGDGLPFGQPLGAPQQ